MISQEQKRKKELEDALVHRKRSSRIAIKESEKEEARAAARKRVEEEEKMTRGRRLELRLQKEEGAKKESAREQRRREREAKAASSRAARLVFCASLVQKLTRCWFWYSPKPAASATEAVKGALSDLVLEKHEGRRPKRLHGNRNGNGLPGSSGTTSGSRTPAGDDWILDCEICHRRGVNLVRRVPFRTRTVS